MFSIKTDDKNNNILYLNGNINFNNVMEANLLGIEIINNIHNVNNIKIDLSGVIKQDSSFLALLSSWVRLAKAQNKVICFCNIPQHLEDLIRVSGLDTILRIEKH